MVDWDAYRIQKNKAFMEAMPNQTLNPNQNDINGTGYGVTGHPEYPYHGQYTHDHYYGKPKEDSDMREQMQVAKKAIGDLQQALEAIAITRKDHHPLEAFDNFMKQLNQLGLYGLSGGQRTPYQNSIFNQNRKR